MPIPPHLIQQSAQQQQQSPHTPTKQPNVGVSVVSHQLPPNKQVVNQLQQKAVQQQQQQQQKQHPVNMGIVAPTIKPQQPPPLIGKQNVLPPHHSPHMLPGAVPSPPLKQLHMTNQQQIGQGRICIIFLKNNGSNNKL